MEIFFQNTKFRARIRHFAEFRGKIEILSTHISSVGKLQLSLPLPNFITHDAAASESLGALALGIPFKTETF